MIDQLRQTINFDCNTSYYSENIQKLKKELQDLNAAEIKKSPLEYLYKDLAYHVEKHKEEVVGCKKANEWVKVYF